MIKYQFQIIRYMHDRVTAEFINVGIIVYHPETNFLKAKFINKYSRISNFFTDVNGKYLLSTLKYFEKKVANTAKQLNELFINYSSLDAITNSILQKDDSALYATELQTGLHLDAVRALEDLYERLVNKYNHEDNTDYHDDTFIWKKIYKDYFDENGIASQLKPYTIQTEYDSIDIDKAFKNGVWNCLQPISFDFKRVDTIKNKVRKWSDILSDISNSDEQIDFYILTQATPEYLGVSNFIEEKLLKHNNHNLHVKIINETGAEKFVADMKEKIRIHEESLSK